MSDQLAREQALDYTKSYIVQAPAGSGKTELLTQRVLNLLSIVNKPEEIVAVTFTRKAAGEMRARIIEYLSIADSNKKNIISEQSFKLAQKALGRNNLLNWNLLLNPSRLNITTIDSLCASIVKQMPVLSRIGGGYQITDSPEVYYKQAVSNIFKLINTDKTNNNSDPSSTSTLSSLSSQWTDDFIILFKHFDYNYNKLSDFLLSMLYKRDQWLPYIALIKSDPDHNTMHTLLKDTWGKLSADIINTIDSYISLDIKSELDQLIQFSYNNIENKEDPKYSSIVNYCLRLEPDNISNYTFDLLYYQAISVLLFTKSSNKINFRKRLDKRMGFPSIKEDKYKK